MDGPKHVFGLFRKGGTPEPVTAARTTTPLRLRRKQLSAPWPPPAGTIPAGPAASNSRADNSDNPAFWSPLRLKK